jgi:hypothetical protein
MPMKRIWGFVLGGVVMAVGGGTMLSACAHDDSTLFVQSVLAPQLVTPGTGCVYTNDPTQPFLSSGVLDTALRSTYDASYLLANQLVPRGDPTAPQTETSYINIQGAVVRINDSMGNQLRTFTRLGSVVIDPAQGTTPGLAPFVGLTIVDEMTVANLGAMNPGDVTRLVVYTKFFGDTLGGQYVESDDYEFPVYVCNQCLISFSVADVNPSCASPNCYGNAAAAATPPQIPCDYEDYAVDCSACKSFAQACDPRVACIGLDGGATVP